MERSRPVDCPRCGETVSSPMVGIVLRLMNERLAEADDEIDDADTMIRDLKREIVITKTKRDALKMLYEANKRRFRSRFSGA